MKRILIAFLLVLNIGIAYSADKTITSKTYVENQLATKQDTIPAVDTNTVITHTGTAGDIGEKGIYDSTGNYAEQQTALMTAGDANTGINNALENEFICIEEDTTDHTCLIWQIKNPSPQRILPEGYTALEYLESTGKQWIDTGISGNVHIKAAFQSTRTTTKSQVMMCATSVCNKHTFFGSVEASNVWSTTYQGQVGASTIPLTHLANIDIDFQDGTTGKVSGSFNDYTFNVSSDITLHEWMIFATSTGNTTSFPTYAKAFWVKMYKNSSLVANFIPARRDSDGELGMYDLVSNQFFTNRGSGTFVAGPDLDVYIPSGN